jgi:hypothetical protein
MLSRAKSAIDRGDQSQYIPACRVEFPILQVPFAFLRNDTTYPKAAFAPVETANRTTIGDKYDTLID